jgi:hypothetical protein
MFRNFCKHATDLMGLELKSLADVLLAESGSFARAKMGERSSDADDPMAAFFNARPKPPLQFGRQPLPTQEEIFARSRPPRKRPPAAAGDLAVAPAETAAPEAAGGSSGSSRRKGQELASAPAAAEATEEAMPEQRADAPEARKRRRSSSGSSSSSSSSSTCIPDQQARAAAAAAAAAATGGQQQAGVHSVLEAWASAELAAATAEAAAPGAPAAGTADLASQAAPPPPVVADEPTVPHPAVSGLQEAAVPEAPAAGTAVLAQQAAPPPPAVAEEPRVPHPALSQLQATATVAKPWLELAANEINSAAQLGAEPGPEEGAAAQRSWLTELPLAQPPHEARLLRPGDHVILRNCKVASLNDQRGVVEFMTPCGRYHIRLEGRLAGHKLCWVRPRFLILAA